MIEKTENPLGLNLKITNIFLAELQRHFDDWQASPAAIYETLDESSISIDIEYQGKKHPYTLEQLKKLKAELSDPVINAVKEFA